MTDRNWVSTDGDWDAATSWSGGVAPISNDRAFMPSTNSQAVTTDLTGLTAVDLDLLYVDRNFTANVGTDGGPIQISADLVKVLGSGAFHYKDGDGTTDLVIVNQAASTSISSWDGTSITKIILLRGTATIQSSAAAITTVEVGWVNNRQADANLTVEAGAGTITNLIASGGNIVCNAAVTNAWVDGASYTQDTATITTLDVFSGEVNYDYGTGTITTVNLRGGHLDLTKNDFAKTITTLNRFPNSRLSYDPDIHTITTLHDLRENK